MARKKNNNELENIDDDMEFLSSLAGKINDKSSTGKVAWLGDEDDDPSTITGYISTGCLVLDRMIANKPNGGIPIGRITEISGEEASGKSLMAMHLIASVQKMGGLAFYIDTEQAFSADFASRIGVDTKKLWRGTPDTLEQAFEIIEAIIKANSLRNKDKPILIIWDSVAATSPSVELEGTFNPNEQMGVGAKTMSRAMRKILQTMGREHIAMVFLNQLRYHMKQVGLYGDPFTTPYGKALPYASSIRIRLTVGGKLKNEDKTTVYGINTHAEVIKNRLGPPKRKCDFEILFSSGINDSGSTFDTLKEKNEITGGGAGWYVMKNVPLSEEKIVPEMKFRNVEFEGLLKEYPTFSKHCMNLLDKHLVITYEQAEKEFVKDASI